MERARFPGAERLLTICLPPLQRADLFWLFSFRNDSEEQARSRESLLPVANSAEESTWIPLEDTAEYANACASRPGSKLPSLARPQALTLSSVGGDVLFETRPLCKLRNCFCSRFNFSRPIRSSHVLVDSSGPLPARKLSSESCCCGSPGLLALAPLGSGARRFRRPLGKLRATPPASETTSLLLLGSCPLRKVELHPPVSAEGPLVPRAKACSESRSVSSESWLGGAGNALPQKRAVVHGPGAGQDPWHWSMARWALSMSALARCSPAAIVLHAQHESATTRHRCWQRPA
mmetsp:Transcript_4247/g.13444  ORF Transcript_4247/g.13444 Transcript_4247/m.13444 type:complete len:291 (-) Transcript_4247:2-874(-)